MDVVGRLGRRVEGQPVVVDRLPMKRSSNRMSFGLGKVLAGVLHGVGAFEPVTLAGMMALLAVVAWTAILVPAHRAASADPLRAIRYE